MKPYESMEELFAAYEHNARVACAILICHHDTLIDATKLKLGKGTENKILDYNKQDLQVMMDVCGKKMEGLEKDDVSKRAALMGAFVDLMTYDLEKQKEGVSMEDFQECAYEFM